MMKQLLHEGLGAHPRPRSGILWGFSLALAVGLSACSGSPHPVADGVTLVGSQEDYVTVSARDTVYVDASYRLAPGDEIEMNFLFDHSMDSRFLVRPDGGVNLPILGDMVVAGQTPGALARQISEAYGRYYTNPQLFINLTKFAPPQCYVLGEVRYPRAVDIRPGMTVLAAIATAGGPVEGAHLNSTLLLRRTAGNQAVGRRLNLTDVANARRLSSDLYLQDFDIIYVPKTFLGKLNAAVDQLFSKTMLAPQFYMRGWEAFNTERVYRIYPVEAAMPTTNATSGPNSPEEP